jgi:hypothetical protein
MYNDRSRNIRDDTGHPSISGLRNAPFKNVESRAFMFMPPQSKKNAPEGAKTKR